MVDHLGDGLGEHKEAPRHVFETNIQGADSRKDSLLFQGPEDVEQCGTC